MKKFIAIFVLSLIVVSGAFSYNPTEKDTQMLNNLYSRLDTIWNKSPIRLQKLWKQMDILKEKYKDNERVYFLLSEAVKHINDRATTNSGSTIINLEAVNTNSGSTTTNSGAVNTNSGSTTTNSGSVNTNSGATTTNSGSVNTNSGSTTTNSGSVNTNSGSTTTNSGSTNWNK